LEKETLIINEISQYKNILPQNYKIINCESQIEDKNSVRDAIKVGKDSSMWKAIESVKNKRISFNYIFRKHWSFASYLKLLIKMMDGIDKPAIAGLWPNFKGVSVVMDLGANIEFNEKKFMLEFFQNWS